MCTTCGQPVVRAQNYPKVLCFSCRRDAKRVYARKQGRIYWNKNRDLLNKKQREKRRLASLSKKSKIG